MSAFDSNRRLESENLAQARIMTQHILRDWNFLKWDDLLADDVTLLVKLRSINISLVGNLAAVGGNFQVTGREDAKRVLKSIYDDIKRGLSVTTEIVSGYDVALLGTLTLESTREGAVSDSWPVVIYMKFDPYGMINLMIIASVDLQPLTDAIRSAVQTGAFKDGMPRVESNEVSSNRIPAHRRARRHPV